MIAPVPPDPEPQYVGTSVCWAPGYTPPAQYLTGPDTVVMVVVLAAVLAFAFVGMALRLK